MMKKLLYITNISNGVSSFSIAAVKAAQNVGIEFHLAGNFSGTPIEKLRQDEKEYGIKIHQIDLSRRPYSKMNYRAYKQLIMLIRNEKIDFIHCNTPVGGLLGRLAGKKCKVNKVIYQAHGFHFYGGAPVLNWVLYYPVEKWLARITDVIITINKEDFERAKKFKLRGNGPVYYVPGVGIDLTKIFCTPQIRDEKRKELKLNDSDIVVISVGELNKNKNNQVIIEAIAAINKSNIHYYICGIGEKEKELRNIAKNKKIENQIHFLGYRSDIYQLLQAADIFVMPSLREGLSRSLMEAMAVGLPCVVSKIRGNTELIDDNINGFLCTNVDEYVASITKLIQSPECAELFVQRSLDNLNNFSIERVEECIVNIYSQEFK